MTPRTVGLLMATSTALSWAVLAIALKYSLQTYSAGTIVWARMAMATLLMMPLAEWRSPGALRRMWRPSWLAVLAAASIAFNYFGFMKGIELTTASNAQIMIQLAPLSFGLLSILFFRERPTRVQLIGLIVALVGFAFFYWDQILVSMRDLDRFQLGNLWLLGAATTWTIFALIQKRLLRTIAPLEFNLIMFAFSTLFLLPQNTMAELAVGNWIDYSVLVFLGLNSVVAYGAFSEAVNRIPAAQVSVIIAVNPLLTLAIMTCLTQMEVEWIKGEPIHWRGGLGALLVVMGVILTVRRPRR